ncbi:MAG: aspartate kinase [Ignavibacteria bacterium]|nr:aspartate kinase [Ignavibacteria bacterium]
MIVMKFGGTSVADATAMKTVLSIVRKYSAEPLIVVLSACSGITNKILKAMEISAAGDKNKALDIYREIEIHHLNLINELIDKKKYKEEALKPVKKLLDDLKNFIEAANLLGELTDRTSDSAVANGELLSTNIFEAACRCYGIESVFLDIRNIICTDSAFGSASVDFDETSIAAKETISPLFGNNKPIITQGFIASDSFGRTTTLGRGGSDYSAAIIGWAVDAGEIQIWTDVNGVMSGDPRILKNACTLPEMSFTAIRWASYFGAKVLHPDTIKPALDNNIPVRVLNTFEMENPGTTILNNTGMKRATLQSLVLQKKCMLRKFTFPDNIGSKKTESRFQSLIDALESKVYYQCRAENLEIYLTDVPNHDEELFLGIDFEAAVENIPVSAIFLIGEMLTGMGSGELFSKLGTVFEKYPPEAIFSGMSNEFIVTAFRPDDAESALKALHEIIVSSF